MVEVNCKDNVVKARSIVSKPTKRDPECQSVLILSKSSQGPVLWNLIIETAAAECRGTVPFWRRIAASIDVHVAACIAVAHLKIRLVIVTDRVIHPGKIIRLQIVLLVLAPYKKAKKTKHPMLTTKRNIRRVMESLPRRDTSPGRALRETLLLIEEKLVFSWLSFT
jgi:hypothetical protein